MYELPKGGDLHNHLGGAVYAESMIGWGARRSESCRRTSGPSSAAMQGRPVDELLDVAVERSGLE